MISPPGVALPVVPTAIVSSPACADESPERIRTAPLCISESPEANSIDPDSPVVLGPVWARIPPLLSAEAPVASRTVPEVGASPDCSPTSPDRSTLSPLPKLTFPEAPNSALAECSCNSPLLAVELAPVFRMIAPPLLSAVPADIRILPPVSADLPDLMTMSPCLPVDASPVSTTTEPLGPLPDPVAKLIEPLLPSETFSVVTAIMPDLDKPAPLVSNTLPPDSSADKVSPAAIIIFPPTPVSPPPTLILTSPPAPSIESPVKISSAPEYPPVALPEDTATAPLSPPVLPALGLCNVTEPLEVSPFPL